VQLETREFQRSSRPVAAAVIAFAALSTVHALRVFQTRISDDAFILFRYARHLADGYGLVWNIGEPPVEGFTSLLTVLVTAAMLRVGVDPLVFSQLLGLGGAFLACLAAAWLAHEVTEGDGRATVMTAAGVALAPALAAWARAGMETTLFGALLAGSLACWMNESRREIGRIGTSVLLLLACLTRPEALLAIAVIVLLDLCPSRAALGKTGGAARSLAHWWSLAAGLFLLVVVKLLYFGDVLPNTFYAKTGGGLYALRAGLTYVVHFFRNLGVVNLMLLAVAICGFRFARRKAAIAIVATSALYVAHVALVGGDYQGFWRYLVPLLPLLVTLSACGILPVWDDVRVPRGWRRVTAAVCILSAAAFEFTLPSLREISDRRFLLTRPWSLLEELPTKGDPYASQFRDDFVVIGRMLKRVIPPGRTLGAIAVGATGYYSELPILDLLGLNDREIARMPVEDRASRPWVSGHMKGNAQVILRRGPDYLLLSFRAVDRPNEPPPESIQKTYPFVGDLLRSPEFQSLYVPDSCQLPNGRFMNLYRRKELPRLVCPAIDAREASGR
jgi:hypothetical protein